jgi:membrane-associated phospholipid phosphatase
MRQKIAALTSSVLNPFLVSFITVILIVLKATESLAGALEWSAIALVFSVLPVFTFVVWQVRRKKLDSIFPETQGQRKVIYLLASLVAAAGCGVTWWFGAPELLSVSFTAGLAAIVVFMTVNLYWKISLHTAFVSAAATILTLDYGAMVAWTFVLLPVVAWARLELRLHTPAQVAVGAVLAAVIIIGVCRGLGVAL